MRDVIRNFNADGFGSLYPKYKGGRPPKFTAGQRREIKKIAKARPVIMTCRFGLEPVQAGRVPGRRGGGRCISHEGLRTLLREEGVTFQRLKTWKTSTDPQYAEKKARIEQLYAIADREVTPGAADPQVVFCNQTQHDSVRRNHPARHAEGQGFEST